MDWNPDALWSKAKLYMDRAINEQRDGSLFPFWCSLALEFLARSALAKISPTLLAEPDREMKNILYALGKGTPSKGPKSINAILVFDLCKQVVPDFGPEEKELCEALSNRRNEELHSGGLPFEIFKTNDWLAKFYETCAVLLKFQARELQDLLGAKEAGAAQKMIDASKLEVLGKVKKSITAHKTIFEEKPEKERHELLAKSEALAKEKTALGGHRVVCPACGAKSWVTGEPISRQDTRLEGSSVVERVSMLPTSFACVACGLKLTGHSELQAVGLGGQFTRSLYFDAVYYYGMEIAAEEEYNNE
jgi:hypothetical protein